MGGMAASTMGYNAWVVIHGPIGRKLGLNHAGGLLGPGDRGNVAIGRAIRLGMMNLAGLKTDLRSDERRVGKDVSVRVDLGGSCRIQKKTTKRTSQEVATLPNSDIIYRNKK